MDNRSDNLRFLCPNCHSQTETHGIVKLDGKLCACGNKTIGEMCKKYALKARPRRVRVTKHKIQWPTPDKLVTFLEEKSVSALARELGVSDKAIKKHCIRLGIPLKPFSILDQKYSELRSDRL